MVVQGVCEGFSDIGFRILGLPQGLQRPKTPLPGPYLTRKLGPNPQAPKAL